MRLSEAIACRTSSTSAPNSSHTFAISFMNEMRVASMAFAAYLQSSALAQSITMIGAPVRVNGAYSSRIMSAARSSSAPMTTRSGFRKSSTAAPCLRNSGLLTTLNGCVVSRRDGLADALGRADRHRALVDDDLVAVHRRARTSRAAPSTCWRSAEPSSPVGVPTAMKMTSELLTAFGQAGRERQPLLGAVAPHELLEPRLVDRDLPPAGACGPWPRPCRRRRRRCRFRRSTRRPPARHTLSR